MINNYEQVNGAVVNRLLAELSLYKQALTKAISLPKGELPYSDEYYACLLNGNCVVKRREVKDANK